MPRNKTYTIQDIIARATTCFWEKGFDSSSIDDLVNATGVNRKILYDNFYNKEGLFTETLKQVIADREESLFAILDQKPHSIDNIRQAMNYLGAQMQHRGCMIMLTLDERSHTPARAFILAEQHFMRFKDLIELNLRVSGLSCVRFADLLAAQYAAMSTLTRLGYDQEQLAKSLEPLLTQITEQAKQSRAPQFHTNVSEHSPAFAKATSRTAIAAYDPPLHELHSEQKNATQASQAQDFWNHLLDFQPSAHDLTSNPAR